MADKMHSQEVNQLPGGKLWEPTEKETAILSTVKPTNDAAESVLGLNNWIQKTTANLSQQTVTNMVEAKKNGTMPWFAKQAGEFKNKVIKLA